MQPMTIRTPPQHKVGTGLEPIQTHFFKDYLSLEYTCRNSTNQITQCEVSKFPRTLVIQAKQGRNKGSEVVGSCHQMSPKPS